MANINLKEAFRYQKYLDTLFSTSSVCISIDEQMFSTKETHHYNASNPDKEDEVIDVEVTEHFENDNVLRFMMYIIEQKEMLTEAINKAKASMEFDLDATVASNQMRRVAVRHIKNVLSKKPSTYKKTGTDYKFNGEGNQVAYYYNIDVEKTDIFDRNNFKNVMRALSRDAEKKSTDVDVWMVNTVVEYDPPFDVDDSFEQAMEVFVERFKEDGDC